MLIHRASLRKDALRVDITYVENPRLEAWKVSTYKENNNKEALVCMQTKYIIFYSMVISIQGICLLASGLLT